MATCDDVSKAILQQAETDAETEAAQAHAEYLAALAAAQVCRTEAENAAQCVTELRAASASRFANAIALLQAKASQANTCAAAKQGEAEAAKQREDNALANATVMRDALRALNPNAAEGSMGPDATTSGTWSPAGADAPEDAAQANDWQVTASPATAWIRDRFINGAGGQPIHWNGTAWASGKSVLASGATAGAPGSFIPPGSQIPADLAAVTAANITASPTSVWATGQSVQPADGSDIYWDGTAWQAGTAPAIPATGATAGTPGTWTPPGSTPPANLAAVITANITASPTSAWTTGQSVKPADNSDIYWDGTAWQAGTAPAPGTTTTARSRS